VNILRTLRFAAFGAVVSIAGYLTLSATQLAARTSEPTSTLIIPGQGAGPLKLGDTRTKVLKLFPFKPDVDQEFPQEPDCGIELNWVDMKNPKYGNVFIRFRDNTAFQIDVATNRYRTSQGITTDSSPQEVRKHYAGLHSYILSEITNEALGGVHSSIGLTESTASLLRLPMRRRSVSDTSTKSLCSGQSQRFVLPTIRLTHQPNGN